MATAQQQVNDIANKVLQAINTAEQTRISDQERQSLASIRAFYEGLQKGSNEEPDQAAFALELFNEKKTKDTRDSLLKKANRIHGGGRGGGSSSGAHSIGKTSDRHTPSFSRRQFRRYGPAFLFEHHGVPVTE